MPNTGSLSALTRHAVMGLTGTAGAVRFLILFFASTTFHEMRPCNAWLLNRFLAAARGAWVVTGPPPLAVYDAFVTSDAADVDGSCADATG